MTFGTGSGDECLRQKEIDVKVDGGFSPITLPKILSNNVYRRYSYLHPTEVTRQKLFVLSDKKE